MADDHPIIRTGVKNELLRHSDVEVLGEAANGDETLRQVQALQPDVLLLDINMPGSRAVQVVRQLQELPSPPRILVLTAYGDVERVLASLKAVAQGWKNAQIAQALYISVGTVKNHVTGLCRKVGARSRSTLVAWAWQQGLMDDR